MTPREEIGGRMRAGGRGLAAFNVTTVLAVLLLSVLGAVAAVLLGGWADELRADDRSGEHVLSQSATGYGALMTLLQETGVETSVLRSDAVSDSRAVRVYTLSRPATSSMLEDIAKTQWQLSGNGGPVLFVMPKWRTVEDPGLDRPGWVRRIMAGADLHFVSRMGGAFDRYGPDFTIARDSGIQTYDLGDASGMADEIDTALGRSRSREVKVEALQYLAPGWTDVAVWDGEPLGGDGAAADIADTLEDLLEGARQEEDAEARDPALPDAPIERADEDPLLDDDFDMESDGDGDGTTAIDSVLEAATIPFNTSSLLIGPDLTLDGKPVFFSVHDTDGDLLYHVLTDPDLLNTQGLSTRSRARLGLGIMDHMRTIRGDAPTAVSFDLTLHGFARSSNLIKTLTRPPLLGATLCALVAAFLVGWMAFGRFGDPVRSADTAHAGSGKRALIDNGARLIRIARRTLGLADDYAALSQRRVLRRLRLTGERDARVQAALEGLGRQTGADIPAQLHAIAHAPDTGTLVRAARSFHDTVLHDTAPHNTTERL